MATCSTDTKFHPYEKMEQDTNCWESRKLDSIKKWVALEKIHGANFSLTATGGDVVKVARRRAYLEDGERFFGVWDKAEFLEGEVEKAKRLFRAVFEMQGDAAGGGVDAVIIFGELFGGYYPHPSVPCHPGAIAVQREVVYCPELRFIAYDIAIMRPQATEREYMDYDVCMQLFKDSGFMYAEPLCTGTLQQVLDYPLGFITKLPAKFGLPPITEKPNVAEGVVIKPLKNVMLESKNGPKRVIFKRKVENFMERKKVRVPRENPKGKNHKTTEKGQRQRQHEDFQLLKYEMYALVTEQRLVNVISKQGMPESEEEWEETTESLVADVLEDLALENEELWAKYQKEPKFMKRLMRDLQEESVRTVTEYRDAQES